MATEPPLTNGNYIDVSSIQDITSFKFYKISKPTRKLLKANNYKQLFPVQYRTYDSIFSGKDILVQARTGTGKTLAFVLPLVEKLHSRDTKIIHKPIILILAPTRELVQQITRDFSMLADKLSVIAVYGGVPYQNQITDIEKGADVVVGK